MNLACAKDSVKVNDRAPPLWSFSYFLNVFHRRQSKKPSVLPIKLRWTLIANLIRDTGSTLLACEEKASSFFKTNLFLILDRSHVRRTFKVLIERRRTHINGLSEAVDSERLSVLGSY